MAAREDCRVPFPQQTHAVMNGGEAPGMSHSRRSFLKWSLATGGALAALPLLEACGSRSAQPAAAPPAATSAPPAAAAPAATTSAAAPAAAAPTAGPTAATRTGITSTEWNPETIKAQAGTLKVDTKTEVAKVTPLDYKGQVELLVRRAQPGLAPDRGRQRRQALGRLEANLPRHPDDHGRERPEPGLQPDAGQAPHGRGRQCRA